MGKYFKTLWEARVVGYFVCLFFDFWFWQEFRSSENKTKKPSRYASDKSQYPECIEVSKENTPA